MRKALDVARRLGVSVVVAGVLGLPLALAWATTHTEVTEKIGTSPTTFTLTTQGHSELRLGIAGTVYLPISKGPLGIIATLDGPGDPGAGDGDLAAYVRPEMLELYTGLFHDPKAAVDEYVSLVEAEFRHQLIRSILVVAGVGGLALFALHELLPLRLTRDTRRDAIRLGLSGVLVLGLTSGIAWVQVQGGEIGRPMSDGTYPLTALDGSAAAGATTDSPVLRVLLGGAISKAQVLIDRQEADERNYRETAEAGLAAQADLMEGPREGELAVMMQSDMHCITTMIELQKRVFSMLSDADGTSERPVPSLLAIAGDLTTNGTAAEGVCIRDEAAIADGAPIAAISGNHESAVSEEQMADAGMTVLDGSVQEIGGFKMLGDGDPSRTELFGATRQRGEESQADQGRRLRDVAERDRPDLVLMHEGYAVQSFLGIDSVTRFLDEAEQHGRDPRTRVDDGIPDVPASAVFYGHWHRSRDPQVIWNDDGTWTLMMELDTTGGAVATPTLNNFSTPWSSPQQAASFPVLFMDQDSRLITGYQLYRFATDGTVTLEPRVDVGE